LGANRATVICAALHFSMFAPDMHLADGSCGTHSACTLAVSGVHMECSANPSNPRRSLDDLEAEITELAGHLNAAHHRWLTLIAEFDRRNGWSDGACPSCAHWLNFKCGIDVGAARERLRVAHALEKLPKISAAMARGELSYSKVRAVTRIANEAIEDTLLMYALHGTAQHVDGWCEGTVAPRKHRNSRAKRASTQDEP